MNRHFFCCSKLKEVKIPDSVTIIGRHAFDNCHSLESITLSKSLTSISCFVFNCCIKLRAIEIPDGVTTIEECAFNSCSSLQSIGLPQSLVHIQRTSFCLCDRLTSITLPESLTTIEAQAFNSCRMLHNILIPKNCNYAKSRYSGHSSRRGITQVNELDMIVEEQGQDWLKNRFDSLPLH